MSAMKKIFLAVVVVALLATGLSFTTARWLARHCQSHAPAGANMHDAAWLKTELGLTETQAREIATLEKQFSVKLESYCEAHCSARFALSEELAKPFVEISNANECVERMCAVQTDSEKATLEHILRVRALLTPEQQKRYAALINQQLCTACPMGMHKPS
jgi:Spy/CpxP family protein refolding chaperone